MDIVLEVKPRLKKRTIPTGLVPIFPVSFSKFQSVTAKPQIPSLSPIFPGFPDAFAIGIDPFPVSTLGQGHLVSAYLDLEVQCHTGFTNTPMYEDSGFPKCFRRMRFRLMNAGLFHHFHKLAYIWDIISLILFEIVKLFYFVCVIATFVDFYNLDQNIPMVR